MTFRHSHRSVVLQQRIHLTTCQSFFSWPLHITEFHRLLWWLLGLRGVDALPCEDSDHRQTESTKLSATKAYASSARSLVCQRICRSCHSFGTLLLSSHLASLSLTLDSPVPHRPLARNYGFSCHSRHVCHTRHVSAQHCHTSSPAAVSPLFSSWWFSCSSRGFSSSSSHILSCCS